MKFQKLIIKISMFFLFISGGWTLNAQTAWFVDGFHGGVYGHYPMWQAKFMVEELTKNPDWAICLEIEPETWDTVSVKDADNFKALQKYYDTKGRFGRIEFVNPTWAQPYCYNISGESIIRQFSYGMEKIRQYFPNATFTTYSVEEPCFTGSLPQILKGLGYKYAVLRNPNTGWGGYTSAFGKDMVTWIGPDGTSIPAVPRYGCEELSSESTWQTESWSNSNSFIRKCFANGIQYPVGMTFQDAGWDGGPWKYEYKPTVYTTWTGYIEQVKDKVEPADWHFTQEDIKPGLVWGAQVLQKIAQQVRVTENRLIAAETMSSLNYVFNGVSWPSAEIAEAWRTLMLSQHHDCWIVPYNGKPGNTWADKVTRWTTSSNTIADAQVAKLFNASENSTSKYIRVYNTQGSRRTDRVTVVLPEKMDYDFGVYSSEGKELPAQFSTDNKGNKILYFDASVPGMGYATFELKPRRKSSVVKAAKLLSDGKISVETDYYSVVIDPEHGGTITSLTDKKHNKQLVKKGKELNNLRGYFYNEKQFFEGAAQKAKISIVEDGLLFTRVKVENQIAGNNYYQLITFNKINPRIDFELHIDWDGQPGIGAYDQSSTYKAEDRNKAFYNDKYKLHLEFPLAEINHKLYKNTPFDVCESALNNTFYSSWDSIKHNVILNWIDVLNTPGDYGVALFTDHTTSYLHSEDLPMGLTVQYTGKGLWGRNYTIDGPTNIKYALLPHSGNWEQGEVENASNQWNQPFIAQFVEKTKDAQEKSLFEVNDKHLSVSAVTVQDNDLLVRFYNASSTRNKAEIVWNCKAKKVELVDLAGKTISEVPVKTVRNGRPVTELSLPRFGFQTVKLSGVNVNN